MKFLLFFVIQKKKKEVSGGGRIGTKDKKQNKKRMEEEIWEAFNAHDIQRKMEEQEIISAILEEDFERVKRIVAENPKSVNVKDSLWETPLDYTISGGKVEIAKFLFEMGGRPNPEIYCDGKCTPVHWAARNRHTGTLKWVFKEKVLPIDILKIKDNLERTPLDAAITCGSLETAKFLWEMGGRPNFEIYHYNRRNSPIHSAAEYGDTDILKWVFTKKILPLSVLNVKDYYNQTPLDVAIDEREWETAALLRRLLYVEPAFLAMQRAKRDHHQYCVLRRLPDELLDMIVDEVAARFNLVVVWH